VTLEDARRPVEAADLWVQIGAESAAAAAALGVRIGDFVTYRPNFQELAGGYVASKALDDRGGLVVLLEALDRLPPRRDYDLLVVGAAQEELGSRGARVAAQWLRPQVALSVDTVAGAEPGTPLARATETLGAGPVLRAWEWVSTSLAGTAYHRGLFRRLQDLAEAHRLPHQLDVARTWTDACGTSTAGHGVPTGGLYVARRCAHSPCEVATLSDFESAARLLAAFLGELSGREVREWGSLTRL
jgi:tetrahedral aminopeptidase